jgi:peptidoglycan/LPS O-acetylase OafA/YrhL
VNYRPEIDGLRAIAVVSVILYHANQSVIRGGYIGVDIFFVLSGFLITTIIFDEKATSNFSILRFYERRARRILPALTFVVLACSILSWFSLTPFDMFDFSKSIASVGTFTSNIFFWRSNGYFEVSAEMKPMLHTWSLAVEEQYYLYFPVLALLLPARKSYTYALFIALSLASFMAMLIFGARDPEANFYLTHSRSWELLAGSLCSLLSNESIIKRLNGLALLRNVASMVGLIALLASLFFAPESPVYPNSFTIVPILGTCLLLLFSEQTLVARLLGSKPAVFIGLISYSAYLVHQPLFAFIRLSLPTPPSAGVMLGVACASLPLAWLSWKYIEQPFRSPKKFNQKQIFMMSAASLGSMIIFGAVGYLTHGYEFRATDNERQLFSYANYFKK